MRYVARWNGAVYAVHDTSISWDISVHWTMEEAQAAATKKNEEEEKCEPTSK
jgi:hypothetical protein